MEFYIGQIFTDVYPPEAALWCNSNNAYIEESSLGYEIKQADLPTLEELKSSKLQEINTLYEDAVESLVSIYPQAEQLTFTKQEQEARAYLLDDTTPTPLIDALASGREISKEDLIQKVIARADMFTTQVGYLTGLRQKYKDMVDMSTTEEEVANIQPVYTL